MTTETAVGVLHGPGLTDVRMMTVAHSNFRRELKAPLRPLVPILGRRAFRTYARRIDGTTTPPRGT